jgi:hypothetical protein
MRVRIERVIPRIVIGGPIALIIAGLIYHGGSSPQGGYLRHARPMAETSQTGTLGGSNTGVDARRY